MTKEWPVQEAMVTTSYSSGLTRFFSDRYRLNLINKSGFPRRLLVPTVMPKVKRCVHTVSKSPQRSRTQLWEVALHHTGQEEVNQGNVFLNPVPSNALELWSVVVAEQTGKHLGCFAKVLLIPLNICHKQLSESCWILCPEVLVHTLLAEKPAIHVEAEDAIEHVHAVDIIMVTKEVAVWVGSKNGWRTHLLTSSGHVVGSGSSWCAWHLADRNAGVAWQAWEINSGVRNSTS